MFRFLVAAMSTLVASGVGHAIASAVERDTADAVDVTSLIRERRRSPAGFEAELGYTPISSNGLLLDPGGGCSTHGLMGPPSFETACKAHDFGYDVLRFAASTGHRPDPSARLEADRLLYRDILDTCTTPRCEATAALYLAVVSANSVRQGYQAPSQEPTIPWALLVIAVLVVAWFDSSRIRVLLRQLRPMTPRIPWTASISAIRPSPSPFGMDVDSRAPTRRSETASGIRVRTRDFVIQAGRYAR